MLYFIGVIPVIWLALLIAPITEGGLVSIFNNYDYELSIEFIDNSSTDGTIEKLEKLCEKYGKTVKAIINARNFGGVSNYHGILQTEGDCTIVIPSDFQVPLDIIPELLKKWETI